MKFGDLKYLIAYVTPITCWIALNSNGILSYLTVLFVFILVPILDHVFVQSTSNVPDLIVQNRSRAFYFDGLLYLNLPILYFLLFKYFTVINLPEATASEVIGYSLSMGIVIGSLGINVAHEIGHRPQWYNQIISRALLLTAMYMHFNIEHNLGHHKNVGTPIDPATSRKGESFYRFWLRTVVGSYLSAWKIENDILKNQQMSVWHIKNRMIQFSIIQIAFVLMIIGFYNLYTALLFLFVSVVGFTLLELVNYIEHYGLVRKKMSNGKYEPVQLFHSWNSNHELGRVLLYELTRHSDHHYKSTRKYQVLRHFDESPQLPFGYPGSIIMALIPPLWKRIMDQKLKDHELRFSSM